MRRPTRAARRALLALTALGLLVPLVLTVTAPRSETLASRPAVAAQPRPDVLLIKTDDQVMDSLTGMAAYMPSVASFFQANGREFTNSYVSSPSCCQSRASTFVGRYPHNEGVWSQGKGATLDTAGGLAVYLRKAGYRTALVGKYLNLVWTNPPGYDWYSTIRGTCTGTQTEDCTGSLPTSWYYNFTVATNMAGEPASYVVPGDPKTGQGYNTTWSGSRLRGYLAAALAGEASGTPWFVEWDPTAPHTHDSASTMPQPKYATAPVPGCHPPVETDRSDKPSYVQAFTSVQARQAETVLCPAAQRTLRSVDDQFAAIIAQLQQAHALDHTLIIFTSDNGLMNGEHDMSRKFVPYEPSVRVPLLLSWPGHVAVGKDARLVSNIDILPTVLQATGVPLNTSLPPVDGLSLLQPQGHAALLSEFRYDPGWTPSQPAPIPTWASYTTATMKYIETYTDQVGSPTAVGFREYYDLTKDPGELTNLLADGDPSNNPPVSRLHDLLMQLRTCAGRGTGATACP